MKSFFAFHVMNAWNEATADDGAPSRLKVVTCDYYELDLDFGKWSNKPVPEGALLESLFPENWMPSARRK